MLPVGHIHDDYDEIFKPIASHKWTTGYHTFQQFIEKFLPQCYQRAKNKPLIKKLPFALDWKEWLEIWLDDVKGHSRAASFKFCKGEDEDSPAFWYKLDGLDLPWTG